MDLVVQGLNKNKSKPNLNRKHYKKLSNHWDISRPVNIDGYQLYDAIMKYYTETCGFVPPIEGLLISSKTTICNHIWRIEYND